MFFGGEDNMEFMANSQQESSLELVTSLVHPPQDPHFAPTKQRNQTQASYPDADVVIALSPTTLLDPNRFVCEVCYRGFSRQQNLTLHRRAHNLPFSLKTSRTPTDPVPRKVYLCPEPTCIHHDRFHALGDFGGLKKHYLRKHCTEKNYKCDTCFKAYSVESDLRAHSKICARKKYTCHCGPGYSRGHHLNVHQENSDARDPHTLMNMGESSANYTGHNNNIPFPMLGMGGNTLTINSNENNNTFIGTPISPIQTQSTFYPGGIIAPNESHLCQFQADHIPPAFFPSQSTYHNQHGFQENLDVGLYADILTDRVPLHNVNLDMSLGGDRRNIYGYGEGSSSISDGGFMVDPSSSLNLTNAMHTTSLNGMLNPFAGTSVGGGYVQGGYSGYEQGVYSGYEQGGYSGYEQGGYSGYEQGGYSGYGESSGHLDYRGGMEMEVFNSETTAAETGGSIAPSEQHLNHHGFGY